MSSPVKLHCGYPCPKERGGGGGKELLESHILISFIDEMQKSYHYIALLKAVMRLSMTSLKGADAKEIASSVTAIANEKLKAEKEANAGKKKTGT